MAIQVQRLAEFVCQSLHQNPVVNQLRLSGRDAQVVLHLEATQALNAISSTISYIDSLQPSSGSLVFSKQIKLALDKLKKQLDSLSSSLPNLSAYITMLDYLHEQLESIAKYFDHVSENNPINETIQFMKNDTWFRYRKVMDLCAQGNQAATKVVADWSRNLIVINKMPVNEKVYQDYQAILRYIQQATGCDNNRAKQIALLLTQNGFAEITLPVQAECLKQAESFEQDLFVTPDSNAMDLVVEYNNNKLSITLKVNFVKMDMMTGEKSKVFKLNIHYAFSWSQASYRFPLLNDFNYSLKYINPVESLLLRQVWTLMNSCIPYLPSFIESINIPIINQYYRLKLAEIAMIRGCIGLDMTQAKEYKCDPLASMIAQGYAFFSMAELADIPVELHTLFFELKRIYDHCTQTATNVVAPGRMKEFYQYQVVGCHEASIYKKNYDEFFTRLLLIKLAELKADGVMNSYPKEFAELQAGVKQLKKHGVRFNAAPATSDRDSGYFPSPPDSPPLERVVVHKNSEAC